MTKSTSAMPGCAKQGAQALAALTIIAGLLGVLRRPRNQKGGTR